MFAERVSVYSKTIYSRAGCLNKKWREAHGSKALSHVLHTTDGGHQLDTPASLCVAIQDRSHKSRH